MADDRVIALPLRRRDEEQFDVAPEFTEEGLALAFAGRYRDQLRYVKAWGRWYEWRGDHWAEERTLAVFDHIRKECRNTAARAPDGTAAEIRLKAELNRAKTRAAVETLIRADRRFASKPEDWDVDDWLLSTPAGIIDLRTGENIGFHPERYCTRVTAVAPGGKCPNWLTFLDRVTGKSKGKGKEQDEEQSKNSAEIIAFLQRVAGYCLTGSIREHAMFFVYGTGGNGKGVFLNTLTAIMAQFHKGSPVETFAERTHPAHPTELARLAGARLVTSQETEQGQFWAEARIKSLTGGDPVPARFMRGDYFEFHPKFKLIIVGNHKPQFRSVDEALRRRFYLIPFDVTIPKEEKNHNLAEDLKAEWPGILQWMIEGCLEWQKHGLDAPEAVMHATAEYLDAEDVIGQWIKQFCFIAAGAEMKLSEAFKNWKEYADLSRIAPRNIKTLKAEIEKHHSGGTVERGGSVWHKGIRLKQPDEMRKEADEMRKKHPYYSCA